MNREVHVRICEGRGESHPPALTDPNVNLSVHSARAVQSSGRVPQRPVREQIGRPLPDPAQPCPRPFLAAFQPLVLPPRPAHQMAIHTLAQWDHRGRVERSEVGQPAPKDRVDLLCEVIQRQSGASLQPPGHCLAADIGQLPRIHSRHEACVDLLPFRSKACRGRNAYPQNVNVTCSYSWRRLLSLQYTILVLSGCSCSPISTSRRPIASRTCRAWRSVTQWTTTSSANLSNWTPGYSRVIQASKPWCRKMLAINGETGPPCGVPFTRATMVPSGISIGAFNQRATYSRTHFWSV